MFKTLRDAFKVKEIRMGLLFTFFVLIVIRFGSLNVTPYITSSIIIQLLTIATLP